MTHGKHPRKCRICGNKLTIGGAWYKCSRCGWTDKPKAQKIQEQRHKAEKLLRTARADTFQPTKEEIAFRKKRAQETREKRSGHFISWLKRYKDSKKKHTRAEA